MTSRRTPDAQTQVTFSGDERILDNGAKLQLIKCKPRLNHLLRSRCRIAFVVISILAMLVVVRSGISASRGYALVATQNQTLQLEQENERLKVEIAKLKSPIRIKQIAQDELGMDVPNTMYFSHEY